MAQDVLAVYENYYEKAVLHCNCLKQQIKDQTEHLRTLAEELGDNVDFVVPEGTMNTQIEYINEHVEVLERIYTHSPPPSSPPLPSSPLLPFPPLLPLLPFPPSPPFSSPPPYSYFLPSPPLPAFKNTNIL